MSLLASLLIPLVMALLFALLFHPLQLQLRRWKIPKYLTLPIIIIVTLLILNFLITSIITTAMNIAADKDVYVYLISQKISLILHWIESITGGSFDADSFYKANIKIITSSASTGYLGTAASSLGSFTGSFVIFIIYYVILLSGMYNYKRFLSYVAGDNLDDMVTSSFEEIQRNLVYFIKYKTLLNLLTAAIYTGILYGFGIRYALFWGILNFFLNFIPNFGSLVATVFAVLMALIQLDDFNLVLIMLGLLIISNFVIGSIIEPKVMGDKLRLNTITVIFGLLFWGFIWGIPGMFLSVPLLVMMKVILENFKGLEPIGRIMGYPDSGKKV
jgi:predicted PurR-regulated permease PerM